MLGSLGGATWAKVVAIAPFLAVAALAVPVIARGLDLLVLGESEAFHGGIEVERLKRISIVLVAAATGAAVSVAGVIGFVGIVVPHLLRLLIGPVTACCCRRSRCSAPRSWWPPTLSRAPLRPPPSCRSAS